VANWYGTSRTNYYKVIDEERYQALFAGLCSSEGDIEDFSNGDVHGFGCYNDVFYYPLVDSEGNAKTSEDYDCDGDIDLFLYEMSKILAPNNVFILQTVGNEKLRYLTAFSAVVFPNEAPVWLDLTALTKKMCKEKYGVDFEVKLEY